MSKNLYNIIINFKKTKFNFFYIDTSKTVKEIDTAIIQNNSITINKI